MGDWCSTVVLALIASPSSNAAGVAAAPARLRSGDAERFELVLGVILGVRLLARGLLGSACLFDLRASATRFVAVEAAEGGRTATMPGAEIALRLSRRRLCAEQSEGNNKQAVTYRALTKTSAMSASCGFLNRDEDVAA